MATIVRDKKKELFANAVAVNPALKQAKKWIWGVLIFWIMTRFLLVAAEIYCSSQDYLETTFNASNITVSIMAILLAFAIASGAKALAFLPIAGSVMMIVQTFSEGFGVFFSTAYELPIALRLYGVAFVLASYAQLVCMLLVLLPKKCRSYFDVMATINKQSMSGAATLPKK